MKESSIKSTYKIYADETRMYMDNWNKAYGNKILHILFLIHLAECKDRIPVSYKGSNIQDIFEFNFPLVEAETVKLKKTYYIEPKPFHKQLFKYFFKYKKIYYKLYPYSFDKNLQNIITNHYKAYLMNREFLYETKLPERDITISGLFQEYDLMPSHGIFNKYLNIKREILQFIQTRYPDIQNQKNVAVHYRGTDFSSHLKHLFLNGINLDKDYYIQAINKIENILGKDITYHLFSDDIPFLKKIFEAKKTVIHTDDAPTDWVSMYLMQNIIQSNSTFCWTASLYNKNFSIQPKDGYNYHESSGSIPYGFHQENSILIFKKSSPC